MIGGTLTDKELYVLQALDAAVNDLTVDEFLVARGLYVNSWAPTFSNLRKRELIRRTGAKRTTQHGAEAHVLQITRAGMELLDATQQRAAA